jgi:hypothetical protein
VGAEFLAGNFINFGALKSRFGAIRLSRQSSGRLGVSQVKNSFCDQPSDSVWEPLRSLKSSNGSFRRGLTHELTRRTTSHSEKSFNFRHSNFFTSSGMRLANLSLSDPCRAPI